MKIVEDFIRNNNRINIISNNGNPTPIPAAWKPILSAFDMLVIIPDMHMYLYGDNIDNFRYGASALLDLMNHLFSVQEDLEDNHKGLRVYQIGDLFELRYPGKTGNVTADQIKYSHGDYDRIVNNFNQLNTRFIYGNHDFENRNFAKNFFSDIEGKVYLEHGFFADNWLANPDKKITGELAMAGFLALRELNEFVAKLAVNFLDINKDAFLSVGVRSGLEPDYKWPSDADYLESYGNFLKYYTDRITKFPGNPDLKIAIIGHTHHPYLSSTNDYIYVDTGAWTEGRSDFTVVTEEEIAVCCYKRP